MNRLVLGALALLVLTGCGGSPATESTPTVVAPETLEQTCPHLTLDVTTAMDLAYRMISVNAWNVSEAVDSSGALEVDARDQPDASVKANLNLLSTNLREVSSGIDKTGADFLDPGNAIMTACGTSYSGSTYDDEEEADTSDEPKNEPAPEPKPKFTTAEKKFLKAQEDHSDDKGAISDGRETCAKIGDHSAGWSRNRYIYDREHNKYDAFDAIKYLCPKFSDDLRLAKRTIFYENNDVGNGKNDVRPGTYRTASKVSDCYWARLTKGGDIIDNQFSDYASHGLTVTVRSSDGGFTYSGDECQFYSTARP